MHCFVLFFCHFSCRGHTTSDAQNTSSTQRGLELESSCCGCGGVNYWATYPSQYMSLLKPCNCIVINRPKSLYTDNLPLCRKSNQTWSQYCRLDVDDIKGHWVLQVLWLNAFDIKRLSVNNNLKIQSVLHSKLWNDFRRLKNAWVILTTYFSWFLAFFDRCERSCII